jgi:Fe2+ or Zn2+ uptake regulation protein
MKIDKVIAALDSSLRREILKIIAENPMTVMEVLEKLKEKGINIKYRETVYRVLEKLLDAELVEKYYIKERGLCYKLSTVILIIDLVKGIITTR